MTFKVKSVVPPELLSQMTHDGNEPFIMSERDVFLNDKGVKRVIPLKPIKKKYYHA